jgi:hypothetical protein
MAASLPVGLGHGVTAMGRALWLVSVTADRALASSTRLLPAAQAAMNAARARRFTAGFAAARFVDERGRVVG